MTGSAKHLDVGRRGEFIAAAYLEQNGCRILHRNYRNAHREIDLIYTDGEALAFCEVKTRCCSSLDLSDMTYGSPARAVDRQKQKNLTLAARAYLHEHPVDGLRLRFDVIEVYLRRGTTGTAPSDILKTHHIRNAFPASYR